MYVLMHEIEIAIDVVVKISFRLEIPPWAGFFSRGKTTTYFLSNYRNHPKVPGSI